MPRSSVATSRERERRDRGHAPVPCLDPARRKGRARPQIPDEGRGTEAAGISN